MVKVGGARRHRWLGGEFCDKMKFVIFGICGLERPPNAPNEYHSSLGARKF